MNEASSSLRSPVENVGRGRLHLLGIGGQNTGHFPQAAAGLLARREDEALRLDVVQHTRLVDRQPHVARLDMLHWCVDVGARVVAFEAVVRRRLVATRRQKEAC